MDDSVLQRAVTSIPKESIFLIEDIDCAFPSREDGDDSPINPTYGSPYSGKVVPRKSNVTLSGLLNVLDGVGSEEGKLFFATVSLRKNNLPFFCVFAHKHPFCIFNRLISSTI